MAELAPRVEIAVRCTRLGVKFLTHQEAGTAHWSRLAAWARLGGYENYDKTVYVTLRPVIVYPAGRQPLDDWRVIAHELVHWERQPKGRFSLIKWVLKYATSQKFRAIEEMHAHLVDIRTGRARRTGCPNVPAVVEKMRDWYRLGNVDPDWMVRWMETRL
jgi:hypothetical protein